MYQARNAFLHGDRVDATLLKPAAFPEYANLLRLAAVVYRAALAARLEQRFPRIRDLEDLEEFPMEILAEYPYAEALLRTHRLEKDN